MSGTAFDGSQWLTAVEIGGLVLSCFGGAAIGATLIGIGLERRMAEDPLAAEAELLREIGPQKKRRRYAAKATISASDTEKDAEALITPNVVTEKGRPSSTKSSFDA